MREKGLYRIIHAMSGCTIQDKDTTLRTSMDGVVWMAAGFVKPFNVEELKVPTESHRVLQFDRPTPLRAFESLGDAIEAAPLPNQMWHIVTRHPAFNAAVSLLILLSLIGFWKYRVVISRRVG